MKSKKEYRVMVDETLETMLPRVSGDIPETLNSAMRYSLFAGGKRLRPTMLLAAVDMLGGDIAQALVPAGCVEMIHTYSLIHDDLPGMDDDVLRRGRPTNHVVYGAGQAILAGDGLLSVAFERMLENALRYPAFMNRHLSAMTEIARGAGASGMVAGQSQDLLMEGKRATEREMQYIHMNKTARMFIHPLRAAGCLAGAEKEQVDLLESYGRAFGLLFQASDDVLDVTGSEQEMGKSIGKDANENKLTAVSIYGLDGAKAYCAKLLQDGLDALKPLGGRASFFRALITEMADRKG